MHHCKYCSFSSRHLKTLLRHYSTEHESDPNFFVQCNINSCLNSYSQIDSLNKHIWRKHKETKLKNTEITSCEENKLSDIEDCEITTNAPVNVETPLEYSGVDRREIVKFLLNLRVKHFVSEKTSEKIVTKFSEIIGICLEKTRSILNDLDPNLDIEQIFQVTEPFQNLNSTLESLNTVHQQNLCFKQPPFVSPVQINIQDNDNIVYIPILETLKSLLRHEDILSFVTKAPRPRETSNTIISDFSCGERYKKNSFFSLPNTLQILLYIDDFTLTNPLGTNSKKHKLCAIYFTIGNIPYHLRSKLYTIQLVSLFPSSLIKKHGFAVALGKLIDDLKILETEGFVVETSFGPIQFHGTISCLVADNLAAHEIGGFITSFSSFRCCRFCTVTKDTLQDNFDEKLFNLRTKTSYDTQVEVVKDNPQLSTVYGIKTASVLNDLSFFHVCWNSPSDIAHDLFEGLCFDLLRVVIEHCLKEKYFSLEFINNKIKTFPYFGKDCSNKPSPILFKNNSLYKIIIKQSAAECHNLVSILPLLVAQTIPETDNYWHCYLLFLCCLDYIIAPALNLGQIIHMQELITHFLTTFKNLDDTIHIKPKGHFLIHYGTQFRIFGPLINYSTLRFEGNHSKLKSIFSTCKNYINPCLTIATRHQYLQSLHNMNDEFLLENKENFSKKFTIVPLNDFDNNMQQQILSISNKDDFLITFKSCELSGVTYKVDTVLITGYDCDYEFGIIKYVIKLNGCVYFILRQTVIVEFNTHLHAYILSENKSFLLVKRSDLLSPFALPSYVTEIGELVVRMLHVVIPTKW